MTNLLRKILIPGFLAEIDRKMRLNRPVLRSSRLHFVLWFTFLTTGLMAIMIYTMPEIALWVISSGTENGMLVFILPAAGFWVYKLWNDSLLKRYPWQIRENGRLYFLTLSAGVACFVFLQLLLPFLLQYDIPLMSVETIISGGLEHHLITHPLLIGLIIGNLLYISLQLSVLKVIICLIFGPFLGFLTALFSMNIAGLTVLSFLFLYTFLFYSEPKKNNSPAVFLALMTFLLPLWFGSFSILPTDSFNVLYFLVGFAIYTALLPRINKILARNQTLVRAK